MIRLLILFAIALTSCTKVSTIYVDPLNGDDKNDGTSPEEAWRSIARVNGKEFKPGTIILFAGGQVIKGTLLLDSIDSGTPDQSLTISSYGKGRAIIDGRNAGAFVARNCSFIKIHNIDFKGSGRKNGNSASGLTVDGGTNIVIDSANVSGFRENGIFVLDAQKVKITHVHAFDNGMAGINTGRVYQNPSKFLTKDLYIGDCVTENNPGNPIVLDNHSGSGIIIAGVDGVVVEYCLSRNNGWDMPWEGNGPVGIWAYHSNNVVIQHCISHNNKSNPKGWDGGGFDLDGGVTNSVIQYNLSYRNAGPGYGLFQYYGADPWSKNILRYNVSYDDGLENDSSGIHLWSGSNKPDDIRDALVYNNLIINSFGRAISYKNGNFAGLVFRNNIFISKDEPVFGSHSLSLFENNIFWRTANQPLADQKRNNINKDPLILPLMLKVTELEKPRELGRQPIYVASGLAPWLGTGRFILKNGGMDFSGRRLPQNKSQLTDIGIYQYSR